MKFSGIIANDGRVGAFSPLYVVKCVAIAAVVTIVLLFIFALVVTYSNFPADKINMVIVISMIISNIIGGWLVARRSNSNGWMNGSLAGAVYMLLIFIAGGLISGFAVSLNTFIMIIVGVLSGAVGGIFGINLKK